MDHGGDAAAAACLHRGQRAPCLAGPGAAVDGAIIFGPGGALFLAMGSCGKPWEGEI